MRLTLLIIEGDTSVARLFGEVCALNDWDTDICCDGPSAKQAITDPKPYDMILLSYRVPDTNGVELVKLIRGLAHRKHTPVVMVTGTEGVEEDALAAGANLVLNKPLDMNRLVETVRNHALLGGENGEAA